MKDKHVQESGGNITSVNVNENIFKGQIKKFNDRGVVSTQFSHCTDLVSNTEYTTHTTWGVHGAFRSGGRYM